jgi:hypothetical protein
VDPATGSGRGLISAFLIYELLPSSSFLLLQILLTLFRLKKFKMADLKPPQTTASKLRAMLAQENEIVVCPGVYDGYTSRLALNAGFKILYMVYSYFKL